MIKLIIFDLDGVLVNSRDMHYTSLNMALESIDPSLVISIKEHLSTYDGLSTRRKLQILTKQKGLPVELYDEIWKKKQYHTLKIVNDEYGPDNKLRIILKQLRADGYIIHVASNCIFESLKLVLLKKGIIEYVDYFISNEDVVRPKPNPEMYFKCMMKAGTGVNETVIVEDSYIGQCSASNAGAHLMVVDSPRNVTLESVRFFIDTINNKPKPKWCGKCNIVIPMAGRGSRFSEAGYTLPKPLIDVGGKTMIETVVENLGMSPDTCTFIFIVQQDHIEKYHIDILLKAIAPGCKIITTDGLTEGAACSILLSRKYIDNDTHLLLANSDQYLIWDPVEFMHAMCAATDTNGGISTFADTHPKWSFAKLGEDGYVCEVAEKVPISTNATTGVYYWKYGSDFVKYADKMISKNIRTNNEFYTCPVFNEAIQDGKKVKIFDVEKMYGLGVPEDLEQFLSVKNTM